LSKKEKDPVRGLSVKYPRVLVIKAMVEMLKKKEEVSVERLEKEIISLIKEG